MSCDPPHDVLLRTKRHEVSAQKPDAVESLDTDSDVRVCSWRRSLLLRGTRAAACVVVLKQFGLQQRPHEAVMRSTAVGPCGFNGLFFSKRSVVKICVVCFFQESELFICLWGSDFLSSLPFQCLSLFKLWRSRATYLLIRINETFKLFDILDLWLLWFNLWKYLVLKPIPFLFVSD